MTRPLLIVLTLGTLVFSGCRHSNCRRDSGSRGYGYGNGGPTYTLPPQNIPDGPPPIPAIPPVPRSQTNSGAELLMPESLPPGGKTRSEYTPDPSQTYTPPPRAKDRTIVESPNTAPPKAQPTIATGIPAYTKVKDNIYTGLRPEIEGLDWLKSKGFKTVVYFRTPADDDTTDRRQAEKRDLKFVSWEITPEGINKTFVDELNQLMGDTASRPIFAYSKDGNFNGSIWYLHLRTAEFLTHDEAKVRATQLGLINEQNPYFQAITKYLNQ